MSKKNPKPIEYRSGMKSVIFVIGEPKIIKIISKRSYFGSHTTVLKDQADLIAFSSPLNKAAVLKIESQL